MTDGVPSGDAGVAVLLLLGALDSLATNRERIERTIDKIERNGADPLLVLTRVQDAEGVEPSYDLDRRRHQLEQLYY